jgi:hypothetical protein
VLNMANDKFGLDDRHLVKKRRQCRVASYEAIQKAE